MNDDCFMNPRELLAELHIINARTENAKDSKDLVDFAEQAMLELPDLEAYDAVKRVTRLLHGISWFGPNNNAIFDSRRMTDLWRNEFATNLRALKKLDESATMLNLPVGYFYFGDSSVRRTIQTAIQMSVGHAIPFEELEKLARNELAGEGDTHDARLTWVLIVLQEGPLEQMDISGMVGPVPHYDRPMGGGARNEQNISLAHAARRLNDALPDFARKRWAFQTRLLKWAGFRNVSRNQIRQAVLGN